MGYAHARGCFPPGGVASRKDKGKGTRVDLPTCRIYLSDRGIPVIKQWHIIAIICVNLQKKYLHVPPRASICLFDY
jgi:hypothetical protein